jgi:hypothetical protein
MFSLLYCYQKTKEKVMGRQKESNQVAAERDSYGSVSDFVVPTVPFNTPTSCATLLNSL